MMKMKLRGKFLVPTILLIVLGMGITVLVSYYYSTNEIRRITVEQLNGLASFADQSIGDWIVERQRQVANLSKTSDFMKAVQDGFVGEVTRKRTNVDLAAVVEDYPFYEGIHLSNLKGEVLSSSSQDSLGINIGDRDYFKASAQGEPFFSKVIKSKTTGSPVFVLSEPIKDKEEVKGVILAVVDLNQFSKRYIDDIKIGKTGYAYLYTEDGTVVAYPDKSLIGKLNMNDLKFGSEMLAQDSGVKQYDLDGVKKIVAFKKNDITGWTVVVCAGTDEIFLATQQIGYISLGLTLLVVLGVALVLVFLTPRLVTRPIGKAVKVADAIAAGDLTQRLEVKTADEIGDLAQSLDTMIDSLRTKAEMASAIADGDLTRKAQLASDKDVLGQALQQMSLSLNQIIGQIDQAATQVSVGANQVSDSSHSLSEGASKQASSMEEITSTMTELGSQTQTNAENASQAHKLSISARNAAEDGNTHMQNMTQAMAEINDSSREIAKLNKTIDDIAFQTNLLALNAAVEAARAGKHGKGFAVVAQEVRHLAGRSASAANQTEELIKQSVDKVENGAEILKKTAEALGAVVEEIVKATDLIGEIAAASNEQAQGIAQINQGLSQVEQVTQQNTATAEETSSATEELSSQARKLGQLVAQFRLNDKEAVKVKAPRAKRVSAPKQLPPKTDPGDTEWGGEVKREPGKPEKVKSETDRKQIVRPEDVIALDDDDFGKY